MRSGEGLGLTGLVKRFRGESHLRLQFNLLVGQPPHQGADVVSPYLKRIGRNGQGEFISPHLFNQQGGSPIGFYRPGQAG